MSAEKIAEEEKIRIVYGMYEEYKKEFPDAKDISPRDAMSLLKEGKVLFLDTRKDAEMEISMLPGAVSRKLFEKNPEKYKNRILIAYCTISYRSGKFAEETARKGFSIYNLKGGILAWALEGGKVYDGDGETERIHVYGKKWDYVPEGYESLTFGLLDKFFK